MAHCSANEERLAIVIMLYWPLSSSDDLMPLRSTVTQSFSRMDHIHSAFQRVLPSNTVLVYPTIFPPMSFQRPAGAVGSICDQKTFLSAFQTS